MNLKLLSDIIYKHTRRASTHVLSQINKVKVLKSSDLLNS